MEFMAQSTVLPVSPPQSPSGSTLPRHSLLHRMTHDDTGVLKLTRGDSAKGPRPRQNIIQAHEIIERQRDRGGVGKFRLKGNPSVDTFLQEHFNNRDIAFLVDDAESMIEHWDAATFVLEKLVWKAFELDPDGPDLWFVKHNVRLSGEKDPDKFRKMMLRAPKQSFKGWKTNMTTALKPLLSRYLKGARSKDLVVIVLTDGLWTGMDDVDELVKAIEAFNRDLSTAMRGIPRERQVTFEFVQFGKSLRAMDKLEYLDDHPSVGEFIDCERCVIGGDVFKMLAGSFVKQMDEEDTESVPMSPGLPQMGPRVMFTMTQASDEGDAHELPSPSTARLGFQPIMSAQIAR